MANLATELAHLLILAEIERQRKAASGTVSQAEPEAAGATQQKTATQRGNSTMLRCSRQNSEV